MHSLSPFGFKIRSKPEKQEVQLSALREQVEHVPLQIPQVRRARSKYWELLHW